MRNILLMVVDCLRADHVYEPGLACTPTLDRLVSEGFSFVNAVSHSTTTTPSFSTILTGKYPFEHGVRTHAGMKLRADVPMLPELLREAGYHTYAEVSGPLGNETGLPRGFDEYNYRYRKITIHSDWGEELLRKLRSGYKQPWFVLLHVWSLHRTRRVLPERDDPKYGATVYARALSSIDLYLGRLMEALPGDTLLVFTGDHGEEVPRNYLDHGIRKWRRKLYRTLKKRNLIKTHASHGMRNCSDGHGYGIYDLLVKVPLTLHGAPLIGHGRSERQVRHIDIAPTLLDVIGRDPHPGMTGRSLMEMARGGAGEHREAYMEAAGINIMKREEWIAGLRVENKYKYIAALEDRRFRPELYDLERDPAERRNIAAARPELAADMDRRLKAYGAEKFEGNPMSQEEQKAVLARLKDLGYHD
jgi:arylsulfatase A-like enzyme